MAIFKELLSSPYSLNTLKNKEQFAQLILNTLIVG
tara:strand:- start:64 stop:168 length:105 start_codon:yes stop_codon:yes gene_type:complete